MKNKIIFSISILAVIAIVCLSITLAWTSIGTFTKQMDKVHLNERLVLVLEVSFKKQVQEWKDTIIRGKDPVLLHAHWTAFEKNEAEVKRSGKLLLDQLSNLTQKELIRQFLLEHEAIGAKYRYALESYRKKGFNTHQTDSLIIGLDRQATEELDMAAFTISQESENESNAAVFIGNLGIFLGAFLAGAFTFLLIMISLSLFLRLRPRK